MAAIAGSGEQASLRVEGEGVHEVVTRGPNLERRAIWGDAVDFRTAGGPKARKWERSGGHRRGGAADGQRSLSPGGRPRHRRYCRGRVAETAAPELRTGTPFLAHARSVDVALVIYG